MVMLFVSLKIKGHGCRYSQEPGGLFSDLQTAMPYLFFKGVVMFKCYMCNESAENVTSRTEYSDEVFSKTIFMTFLFTDELDHFIHLCKMCTGIVLQSVGRELTEGV